ncbi:MAG: acyloxyacyl hydrolase [Phycisphaerae bacterium]|nr:acyloxyacyl hydrolase [Phycisphaerae bacterium]
MRTLSIAVCIIVFSGTAHSFDAGLLTLHPAAVSLQPDEAPASEPPTASTPVARYGAEGSRWWIIGGGFASDIDDIESVNLFGAFGYFIIDDVEIQGELGGWYFSQPGDDAGAINPVLNFRWHFLNHEKWTVFAEAGIGIMGASDDVPEGGTSFNFSPRAGVGFTHEISGSGVRLLLGVRWQHFSNARIYGDDENPALDQAILYTGVIFPF